MNPISQKLVVIKDEEDTLEAKIRFKIDAYSLSLVAKSCQLNQHDIMAQSKKCFKVCSNSKLDLENCSRNCFEKFEKLQEYNRSAEFMGIFKKQQQK